MDQSDLDDERTSMSIQYEDCLYLSDQLDGNGGYCYNSYMRYYEDGTIIQVRSSGNPWIVSRWFNKNHDHISRGKYKLQNFQDIKFSTTSAFGTVNYDGRIIKNEDGKEQICLSSHSLITGYRGQDTYSLYIIDWFCFIQRNLWNKKSMNKKKNGSENDVPVALWPYIFDRVAGYGCMIHACNDEKERRLCSLFQLIQSNPDLCKDQYHP